MHNFFWKKSIFLLKLTYEIKRENRKLLESIHSCGYTQVIPNFPNFSFEVAGKFLGKNHFHHFTPYYQKYPLWNPSAGFVSGTDSLLNHLGLCLRVASLRTVGSHSLWLCRQEIARHYNSSRFVKYNNKNSSKWMHVFEFKLMTYFQISLAENFLSLNEDCW